MNKRLSLIFFSLILFTAASSSAATVFLTYATRSGDTLQSVAAANATTTAAIVAMNPNIQLQRGQTLNVGIKVSTPTPPPTPTPTPTPPPPTGTGTTILAYMTQYGFPDNSCANDGTDRIVAGDCTSIKGIDGHAGGDGSLANPITVAVGYVGSKADYAPGTLFYRSDLHKYGIAGDTCAECHSQLNGAKVHIDWWAGGTAANKNTSSDPLLACEDQHTLNANVIVNPPAGLPVSTGPIWSAATGCAPSF